MKLDIVFEGLERLVRRMGASPRSWSPDSVDRRPPIFELIEMELEGDTSHIERDEEKGIFRKNGRAVVLYIKVFFARGKSSKGGADKILDSFSETGGCPCTQGKKD